MLATCVILVLISIDMYETNSNLALKILKGAKYLAFAMIVLSIFGII